MEVIYFRLLIYTLLDTYDMSDLYPGDVPPDFLVTCINRKSHKLSNYRVKTLMMSFLQHTVCTLTGLAMAELKGNYKNLHGHLS